MAAAHPLFKYSALSALFHLSVCFGFLSPKLRLQLGFITQHKGSEQMVFEVIRGTNQQRKFLKNAALC